MECSHKKALDYLERLIPAAKEDGLVYRTRCRRCKSWVGQEQVGYPLPEDFSTVRGIYSIMFRTP